MKLKAGQNRIRRWDDAIFWRVYAIEKRIRRTLNSRFEPSWQAAGHAFLALALVMATLPRVAIAQAEPILDPSIAVGGEALPETSLVVDNIVKDLSSFVLTQTDLKINLGEVAGDRVTGSPLIPTEILTLPESPLRPKTVHQVTVTFYSSEPWQTDSTPFITANGTHVRDGIAATNFLPFHTQIVLPEIFGDKVFVIEDRMNRRYSNRVDIWVPTTEEAVRRGVVYNTTVEVYASAPSHQ
ncbi:MAG: hypothetical protein A2445_04475 [Candidatus Jacksonbacteria bacterium RIFOXYC2_FULL_44_29]|nr:MAG: hypothetical protein UV19_C0003G0018 [Parcubacteria group bacterium GW2011_GWA2_42_28]KKT55837.1 MAG: hypothetical protein UW45_C0004G0018 [Parcubacteria group bacterium GW2011_GWC2_44_22]OGY75616.1 MAG: hypothetical protein A2240_03665 [Candidatus Jacksonbacteria bacterium RIFOXYA2_FULL_43_12]OGY76589.1 MAG: hypothetical protein A2295_01405 [Candidatus Jacksonbacteria bacterium RIFOXYB2_FULL_44_15]OGY78314.1 MAG: hypothetical protein A2445_04475 [Candidatus Jacksonbacteria bacterium RI